MKHPAWLLALALLVSLSGCNMFGRGVEGKLYESRSALPAGKTGMPASGAWVVVRWIYPGNVRDVCLNVALAQTDDAGYFHAPGWVNPANFTPLGIGHYSTVLVYKPGFLITEDPSKALQPFNGSPKRRLVYLNGYMHDISCSGYRAGGLDPEMAPFYQAMYDEARSIAKTPSEKYLAASMHFDIESAMGDRHGADFQYLRAGSVIGAALRHDLPALRVALGRDDAETDGEDEHGATALMLAAQYRDVAMVKLLLASGADPNKGDTDAGDTALFNAVSGAAVFGDADSREILRALLESNKTCTNIRDRWGATATDGLVMGKYPASLGRALPSPEQTKRRKEIVEQIQSRQQPAHCAQYQQGDGSDPTTTLQFWSQHQVR